MFGLIISSRPVLTPPTQLSDTQSAFTIPRNPPFTHLVLFLLPNTSLPADHAAAIHLRIPPSPDFKLLGALAADKPSAIFKVSIPGTPAADGASHEEVMVDDATLQPVTDQPQEDDIVVGISIEPAASIQQQLADKAQGQTGFVAPAANALVRSSAQQQGGGMSGLEGLSPGVVKAVAQRVGKNVFDFMSGWAKRVGGEEVVPARALQEWWGKFEKRVELEPGFLMRGGD